MNLRNKDCVRMTEHQRSAYVQANQMELTLQKEIGSRGLVLAGPKQEKRD